MRRGLTMAAVLVAGLWLACGNDYEEGGPLVGDTGGKCFSDGSCKAGLVCLSNLCVVPPDAGTTSSGGTSSSGDVSEAGTTDASDSGSSDARTFECQTDDTLGVAPGVACESPRQCTMGATCCPGNGSGWECAPSSQDCASTMFRLECDSPVDCASGSQCCFFTEATTTHCADLTLVAGICALTCPPKASPVCDPNHPCASGKCDDRLLVLGASSRILHRGVCAPMN